MTNRIIKFRAWDEDRNIMITDFSKKTPALFQNEDGDFFCGSYQRNTDWQEPVLMQFTGIVDKNGKEIYECDILKDEKSIGVVHYYAPQFVVQCVSASIDDNGVYALAKGNVNVRQLTETEVIGNIYEHHGLLEVK